MSKLKPQDSAMLWSRALGHCTLCKVGLAPSQYGQPGALAGEVAHIVGASRSGPRGEIDIADEDRNSYWNYLLLCPNCHTSIDGQLKQFSVAQLFIAKMKHERHGLEARPPDTRSPSIARFGELGELGRILDGLYPLLDVGGQYDTVSKEDRKRLLEQFQSQRQKIMEHIAACEKFDVHPFPPDQWAHFIGMTTNAELANFYSSFRSPLHLVAKWKDLYIRRHKLGADFRRLAKLFEGA